jgi:glycosyltransferase involved in cell wall biosynthesis
MNILMVTHHPLDPNAGAPGSICSLGETYSDMGHSVSYFSLDDLPERLSFRAKILVFPEFATRHIWQVTSREPVDVVDVSSGDAWIWAKFLRPRLRRTPALVTRSHGLEHTAHLQRRAEEERGALRLSRKYPLYHGGFRLWEVTQSFRLADVALFLNDTDRDYAVEHLGVPRDRAYLGSYGVSRSLVGQPLAPAPSHREARVGIAQLSAWDRMKGVHYSAAALSRVLSRYPQTHLSLVGTRCPRAEVLANFPPEIHDRIRVYPSYDRAELPKLLEGHYIKVFPTLSEGFGKSLLEAMACGLVPITTATPGPLRLVRHEVEGLVVPTADTPAIEAALERLLTDRELLHHLRERAHAAAQGYSWDRVARETIRIYESAIRRAVDGRRGSKSPASDGDHS